MKVKIPYRVNWMGAYLDCIGKPVITSIIDKYITATSKKRKDKVITVFSKEFNHKYEANLEISATKSNTWTDYVDGCIAVFAKHNFILKNGCNIIIANDLPSGLGLSSSAAFIIAILKTIAEHNKLIIKDSLIAYFAYWVEHTYLGIPCGKMDFKAVLHSQGIWQINTSDLSLNKDRKITNKRHVGLIIYTEEQHSNLNSGAFSQLALGIKVASISKGKSLYSQYIKFENNVIADLLQADLEGKLDAEKLGTLLNASTLNLKRNLLLQPAALPILHHKIYGVKLLGSGISSAYFLLIDPKYKKEIIANLLNIKYKVIECVI